MFGGSQFLHTKRLFVRGRLWEGPEIVERKKGGPSHKATEEKQYGNSKSPTRDGKNGKSFFSIGRKKVHVRGQQWGGGGRRYLLITRSKLKDMIVVSKKKAKGCL